MLRSTPCELTQALSIRCFRTQSCVWLQSISPPDSMQTVLFSAGLPQSFCAYRCGLSFLRRRSLGVTDSGTLAQSPLHGSSRMHDGAPLVPAPAGHRGFIPPRRGAHPFSVVLVAMCLDSGPLFPWSPFVRTYGTICRISLTDILKPVKPPTQVYTMI